MSAKTKHTENEISLASGIYHQYYFCGMLTPEQDTLLENAMEVLQDAGLIGEDGEWIHEED